MKTLLNVFEPDSELPVIVVCSVWILFFFAMLGIGVFGLAVLIRVMQMMGLIA